MSIQVAGLWSNACGSQLCIEVDDHGDVRGTYQTPALRTLRIVGAISGDRLIFSLDFGTLEPHLAWVGHLDLDHDELDGFWQRSEHHLSLDDADQRRPTTWSPVDHFHRAAPTRTRH